MQRNLGDPDRAARIIVGVVLGFLFLGRRVPGTAGLVLGIVASWLMATSILGWCPFYAIVRASTRSAKDADAKL